MHEYLVLNNDIIHAKDARIDALSPATLYGKGVFTTIAIHSGEPFLWSRHWQRLESSSKKLEVEFADLSEVGTRLSLDKLLTKNGVSNGRARITLLDESPGNIWSVESTRKRSLLITTGDLRPIPNTLLLTVSSHITNSVSPLAGIKSCNYLEKIITLDEAKARGFDEAIQVNERGEVSSATMANVFWLKDNVLYTPSLKTGCLPGTTREFVMENIDCREVEVALDELLSADAIFLTSAGLSVVQVAEFESRRLEAIEHPILELLPKGV